MVVFSHRARGFKQADNSLKAISACVRQGYSVEIDLRLAGKELIFAHDRGSNGQICLEAKGLLSLIKRNPRIFFALHLKQNSQALFIKACAEFGKQQNCLFFVTDFSQEDFLKTAYSLLGAGRLALYANSRKIPAGLLDKVSYLWLDEAKGDTYLAIRHFSTLKKKIVCCSPELYVPKFKAGALRRFKGILNKKVFGVCTDFPQKFLR